MIKGLRFRLLSTLLGWFSLLHPHATFAQQVAVRYQEGVKHGFLSLRSLEGKLLADGELEQATQGDRVTDHLIFRFKDGSTYEDTTVFSQRGSFRLLTDHVEERGPAFPRQMETSIDTATGGVTVRTRGDNSKEETLKERLNLPADVGNGLLFVLPKNIPPKSAETTVSLVVFMPKPRLVKLVITPQSGGSISDGGIRDKVVHYTMQFRIGGVTGWFAALAGKKTADLQAWVISGQAPETVRFEGEFYPAGPIWLVEMAAPEISASAP